MQGSHRDMETPSVPVSTEERPLCVSVTLWPLSSAMIDARGYQLGGPGIVRV